MPSHHKKRQSTKSSDSSDSSDSESSSQKCGRGNCKSKGCTSCGSQSRAYIICPPVEFKESYSSDSSDSSCPDFSSLCEDKPQIGRAHV